MRAIALATVFSMALAVVTGVTAMAASRAPDSVASTPARPMLAQATPSLSADEAAALVRARSGGRVLDVRLEEKGGALTYRVKVLLDGGRVRVYRVDAGSGRVSRQRP